MASLSPNPLKSDAFTDSCAEPNFLTVVAIIAVAGTKLMAVAATAALALSAAALFVTRT